MKFSEFISKGRLRPLLLSLIFGCFAAIPYFFEKAFILTFIALFGEIYTVISVKSEKERIFLPFFIYFFANYAIGYSFIYELYPLDRFGFTKFESFLTVFAACVVFPLFHAALQALIMSLVKLLPDKPIRAPFFAVSFVIAEAAVSIGKLAFPWCSISVSLTGFLPYLQTLSLFGKYFITFITVLFVSLFAYALKDKKGIFAVMAAVVFVLNTAAGTVIYFLPEETGEDIDVACVQGNVPANQKWNTENQGSIFYNHVLMMEEACENGAEVIILPESAVPTAYREGNTIDVYYKAISQTYGVYVIAGVNYKTESDYYNAVVGIYPDASETDIYKKRHLVPFGEYIPYSDIITKVFPFVEGLTEDFDILTAGDEPTLVKAKDVKAAPAVCFDSIFPNLSRESVAEGAQFIVIATNDSWFNDSFGGKDHLRQAKLRAIENKRYVARAANTGISAIIDSKGNIVEQTKFFEKDILYGQIKPIYKETLYTKIGDIVLYICIAAEALMILICIIRRIKWKE